MIKFDVKKNTISQNLRRIQQRFPLETKKALQAELKEVELPETQALVPIDKGDLKSTGIVTEPVVRRNTVTCGIQYGGPSQISDKMVDYAIYVHEDLDALHPHGQAKFISSVLNKAAPHMASRLAERMRFDKWVPNA